MWRDIAAINLSSIYSIFIHICNRKYICTVLVYLNIQFRSERTGYRWVGFRQTVNIGTIMVHQPIVVAQDLNCSSIVLNMGIVEKVSMSRWPWISYWLAMIAYKPYKCHRYLNCRYWCEFKYYEKNGFWIKTNLIY